MATTKKVLHEEIKNRYLEKVRNFFVEMGEEVLQVGSNELSIPVVDKEGNEEYLVIVLKVPTGSRDGDPYDGYAMAEEYDLKQKAKAEKAKKQAEEKAKKMERDRKMREAKAEAKARREAGE